MQVRRDALALLEHQRPLLLGTRLRELDREGGLAREPEGHPQVLLGEPGPPGEPAHCQDAVHAGGAQQGNHQQGPGSGASVSAREAADLVPEDRRSGSPRGRRALRASRRTVRQAGQRVGPVADGDLDGQARPRPPATGSRTSRCPAPPSGRLRRRWSAAGPRSAGSADRSSRVMAADAAATRRRDFAAS